MLLPDELARSPWRERMTVSIAAVRAAGAALMELRGSITGQEVGGGQLKTSTDLAAEGWVLGFLRGSYPDEIYLAEERFELDGVAWPGAPTYWTIDALDGTRSYVDGYPGFCVQIAFVDGGQPCLGVIGEPATGHVYLGCAGAGAWRLDKAGRMERLRASTLQSLELGTRFVDSTVPTGPVGDVFTRCHGAFVECGSVGLKICRVVESAADVYAKRFAYKVWDVAPGEVLARETGVVLSSWDGTRIDYAASGTHFSSVLAAPAQLHELMLRALGS